MPRMFTAAEFNTSVSNEVSHSKVLLAYSSCSSGSSMHRLKVSYHFNLTPAKLQKGRKNSAVSESIRSKIKVIRNNFA